ncbi:E3 ubiquitin-protein ligase listerin [Porphyridium purpureum]|uniref:E3 ubiquitin-protein ligase listerin n=1 Tax=Porphyridium purpureum TaxID=35688 RepID=A0A5J4Z702_PORPP|nr:E3 ubiquitin-protein ligase listerin [Porphyridium purpureum]|eukprot:POR8624..scf295_1
MSHHMRLSQVHLCPARCTACSRKGAAAANGPQMSFHFNFNLAHRETARAMDRPIQVYLSTANCTELELYSVSARGRDAMGSEVRTTDRGQGARRGGRMGKNKYASSSGAAAMLPEHLQGLSFAELASTISGSGGDGSAKGAPSSGVWDAASPGAPVEVSEEHAQLAALMKRAAKKDAVTREKALQDLRAALQVVVRDKKDVLSPGSGRSLLITYAGLFRRLALESESAQARECALHCMGQMVVLFGKDAKAALKAAVPIWFAAQADRMASVQSAARDSLACAFGRQNALEKLCAFARDEIIRFVVDELAAVHAQIGSCKDPDVLELTLLPALHRAYMVIHAFHGYFNASLCEPLWPLVCSKRHTGFEDSCTFDTSLASLFGNAWCRKVRRSDEVLHFGLSSYCSTLSLCGDDARIGSGVIADACSRAVSLSLALMKVASKQSPPQNLRDSIRGAFDLLLVAMKTRSTAVAFGSEPANALQDSEVHLLSVALGHKFDNLAALRMKTYQSSSGATRNDTQSPPALFSQEEWLEALLPLCSLLPESVVGVDKLFRSVLERMSGLLIGEVMKEKRDIVSALDTRLWREWRNMIRFAIITPKGRKLVHFDEDMEQEGSNRASRSSTTSFVYKLIEDAVSAFVWFNVPVLARQMKSDLSCQVQNAAECLAEALDSIEEAAVSPFWHSLCESMTQRGAKHEADPSIHVARFWPSILTTEGLLALRQVLEHLHRNSGFMSMALEDLRNAQDIAPICAKDPSRCATLISLEVKLCCALKHSEFSERLSLELAHEILPLLGFSESEDAFRMSARAYFELELAMGAKKQVERASQTVVQLFKRIKGEEGSEKALRVTVWMLVACVNVLESREGGAMRSAICPIQGDAFVCVSEDCASLYSNSTPDSTYSEYISVLLSSPATILVGVAHFDSLLRSIVQHARSAAFALMNGDRVQQPAKQASFSAAISVVLRTFATQEAYWEGCSSEAMRLLCFSSILNSLTSARITERESEGTAQVVKEVHPYQQMGPERTVVTAVGWYSGASGADKLCTLFFELLDEMVLGESNSRDELFVYRLVADFLALVYDVDSSLSTRINPQDAAGDLHLCTERKRAFRRHALTWICSRLLANGQFSLFEPFLQLCGNPHMLLGFDCDAEALESDNLTDPNSYVHSLFALLARLLLLECGQNGTADHQSFSEQWICRTLEATSPPLRANVALSMLNAILDYSCVLANTECSDLVSSSLVYVRLQNIFTAFAKVPDVPTGSRLLGNEHTWILQVFSSRTSPPEWDRKSACASTHIVRVLDSLAVSEGVWTLAQGSFCSAAEVLEEGENIEEEHAGWSPAFWDAVSSKCLTFAIGSLLSYQEKRDHHEAFRVVEEQTAGQQGHKNLVTDALFLMGHICSQGLVSASMRKNIRVQFREWLAKQRIASMPDKCLLKGSILSGMVLPSLRDLARHDGSDFVRDEAEVFLKEVVHLLNALQPQSVSASLLPSAPADGKKESVSHLDTVVQSAAWLVCATQILMHWTDAKRESVLGPAGLSSLWQDARECFESSFPAFALLETGSGSDTSSDYTGHVLSHAEQAYWEMARHGQRESTDSDATSQRETEAGAVASWKAFSRCLATPHRPLVRAAARALLSRHAFLVAILPMDPGDSALAHVVEQDDEAAMARLVPSWLSESLVMSFAQHSALEHLLNMDGIDQTAETESQLLSLFRFCSMWRILLELLRVDCALDRLHTRKRVFSAYFKMYPEVLSKALGAIVLVLLHVRLLSRAQTDESNTVQAKGADRVAEVTLMWSRHALQEQTIPESGDEWDLEASAIRDMDISRSILYENARALVLFLRLFPAQSRQWAGSDGCSRGDAKELEALVSRRIAPSLIEDEIRVIRENASSGTFGDAQAVPSVDADLSVRGSVAAREILAAYTFSDVTLEVVIRLPEAYPLRIVEIHAPLRTGMSEARWNKTVLGMTKLVSLTDGTLADAVGFWRATLDQHFAGVEECPICYNVLHYATASRPSMRCKTCKHKFHSACLLKWFSTSNSSSCPLCRSPMQ